jgi:hypothetical protein
MKKLGKIVGINLAVLLGYSLLIRLGVGRDGITIMMYSAFLIICQVIFNLLSAANQRTSGNKDVGNSYTLSAIVVLVIGFAVCFGNAGI